MFGAGGNRQGYAFLPGGGNELPNSREWVRRVDGTHSDVLILDLDSASIDGRTYLSLKDIDRGFGDLFGSPPDGMLPIGVGKIQPMSKEDVSPCLDFGCFCIEDETVEIEDNGLKGHGPSLTCVRDDLRLNWYPEWQWVLFALFPSAA